jgi:hypothetical protein
MCALQRPDPGRLVVGATVPEAPFRRTKARLRRAVGHSKTLTGHSDQGKCRGVARAGIARALPVRDSRRGLVMPGIVARVRAIIATPYTEWLEIERETGDRSALFTRYVAILAAIPALAHFTGGSLIGGYTPILSGLVDASILYVSAFVLVYVVALVVNVLAPKFEGHRDFSRALRLTIYAYTPVWLAGIFLLVPGLSFLGLLGLYGVYLLWIGLPTMVRAPAGSTLRYVAAIAATALVLEIVVRVLLAVV